MSQCEICDSLVPQHFAAFHRLAERIAKLEARLPCAVDCAGFHGADCDDPSLQPDGKPPAPLRTDGEPSGEAARLRETSGAGGGDGGDRAIACLLKIVEIVNSDGNPEVVFADDGGGCALTVRIGNHGCHDHMGAGPRIAAGKPEDSRYVAKLVDELHDYLFDHECEERGGAPSPPDAGQGATVQGGGAGGINPNRCPRHPLSMIRAERSYGGNIVPALPCEECALDLRREADRVRKVMLDACESATQAKTTAATPEPASRQGDRLSDAINALPERIRSYVHEIETNCDPAGMVSENVLQRDHIAALEAELAVAESEANGRGAVADDYEKKLADAERERDCGQDGVCAIAPGCLRHWEERARELVRERDELRSENVRLVAKLADMEARVRDAERDADIAELLLAPGHGTPAPKGPTE